MYFERYQRFERFTAAILRAEKLLWAGLDIMTSAVSKLFTPPGSTLLCNLL
jgi:hypothetical protein